MDFKINNVNDLKRMMKYIEKSVVKDALEDTGDEATELAKDRVDKDVYEAGNPTEYVRTYELRESIEPTKAKCKDGVVELEIKHNTDKIGSYEPNQHYTVGTKYAKTHGTDSSEYVPRLVHNGESGKIFGEGFWTKPRPYMSNTKEEMENGKYKEMMKRNLEKRGIKTE
jgi:hypothetical protein